MTTTVFASPVLDTSANQTGSRASQLTGQGDETTFRYTVALPESANNDSESNQGIDRAIWFEIDITNATSHQNVSYVIPGNMTADTTITIPEDSGVRVVPVSELLHELSAHGNADRWQKLTRYFQRTAAQFQELNMTAHRASSKIIQKRANPSTSWLTSLRSDDEVSPEMLKKKIFDAIMNVYSSIGFGMLYTYSTGTFDCVYWFSWLVLAVTIYFFNIFLPLLVQLDGLQQRLAQRNDALALLSLYNLNSNLWSMANSIRSFVADGRDTRNPEAIQTDHCLGDIQTPPEIPPDLRASSPSSEGDGSDWKSAFMETYRASGDDENMGLDRRDSQSGETLFDALQQADGGASLQASGSVWKVFDLTEGNDESRRV